MRGLHVATRYRRPAPRYLYKFVHCNGATPMLRELVEGELWKSVLSSDFWSQQLGAAFKAWAILIPLMLAFCIIEFIKGKTNEKRMRELRAHTEAVESRLQLARDQNAGETDRLAAIHTQIDELRSLIKANPAQTTIEPMIKEVKESASSLEMANRTTDHILTAERLAIGGLNRSQKLKLVSPHYAGRESNLFVIVAAVFFVAILVLLAG
jgi:septal ring factor EnvC (AmiA/AmiB activator)